MILKFSIGNFRSFNNNQTLDFLATGLVSENREVDKSNIIELSGSRILKTLGIYGPNGSGKSNIVKGLLVFRRLVKSSLEREGIMMGSPEPFKLSSDNIPHGGFFQIILQLKEKTYRYGFTLTNEGTVLEEWLFGQAERNETWYFKRTIEGIVCNKEWFNEGFGLPLEKLRNDTLFLTFVSAYDGPVSQAIRSFIANDITFDDIDLSRRSFFPNNRRVSYSRNKLTNQLLEEGKNELVLEWLKNAGLPYTNISLNNKNEALSELVLLQKNIYDHEGHVTGATTMLLNEDDSAGTQKFYTYIGWLHQKFQEGGVFISDEIDNNFHPSLLQKLVNYFNNPIINKAGAQLLFTSHDTNLLQPDILRRDQIYFTEKSIFDETILYALSDLKGIRNNADFARQYLSGFYGALPILAKHSSKDDKQ